MKIKMKRSIEIRFVLQNSSSKGHSAASQAFTTVKEPVAADMGDFSWEANGTPTGIK
jgi:hypothetical protein